MGNPYRNCSRGMASKICLVIFGAVWVEPVPVALRVNGYDRGDRICGTAQNSNRKLQVQELTTRLKRTPWPCMCQGRECSSNEAKGGEAEHIEGRVD